MTSRNFKSLFCSAILIAAVFSLKASADDLWLTDFEKAKALAKETGKDLLMEFTGSDWCPPCIALNKNVLSKEHFKKETAMRFVLLKLDSPRDKSKQPKAEQDQYKKLSGEYGVSGVPTLFLADAQGRPYAKFVGYGGDTEKKYVAKLVDSMGIRKQRDEFFATAENATGAEKAKLLAKAISKIDQKLALEKYTSTIEEIIAADAKDDAGLKSKYEGLLKLSKVKVELEKLQRSFDQNAPKVTITKVDELITNLDLDGEGLQEALFLKGFVQYRSKERDAAKKTLEAALKLAPESERGKQIQRILDNVFKDNPKDGETKKKDAGDKKRGEKKE